MTIYVVCASRKRGSAQSRGNLVQRSGQGKDGRAAGTEVMERLRRELAPDIRDTGERSTVLEAAVLTLE